MKKHTSAFFLLWCLFLFPLAGQSPEEDILVGSFSNQQNGLLLSVKLVSSNAYEGFIEYQGERHPFIGSRLLGMLSGQYIFRGAQISFTLARLRGVYYLTSEGVSLEMVRTAKDPESTSSVGTGSAPSASVTPTPSVQEPITINAPLATGPRIKDPYGSFNFQLATGWSHTIPENSNMLVTHPDYQAQISLVPHNFASLKEIRENTFDIEDAESNTTLTATVRDYGSRGLFVRYEGSAQGQPLVIETIAMISPHGGGISVVGAALRPDFSEEVGKAIKSIANSVQFTKIVDSPMVQQWKQRLTGKQLTYLYTNSGLADKVVIDLCPNGSFQYSSNGSYTSGGFAQFSYAGNDSRSGSWKIVAPNSFPLLVLFFGGGLVSEYPITARQAGNEINLNGKRYFIQASTTCK